ncbi:MAG: metallophosphoesterase [Syntrophaceae bacterium]
MMTVNPHKQRIFVFLFLLLLLSLFITSCARVGVPHQEYLASWKFAVISDTQGSNKNESNKSCINDAVVKAIADDIVRENPDFVLVAGDLVNGWFRNGGTDYTAQYANWKEAMSPVYNAGIRVYPIRGNHDSGPERLALPPLPAHLEPPSDAPVLLKKAFQNAFPEFYIPKNGPVHEEGLTYSFSHKNAFIVGLDQFTVGQHKINQEWLDRQLKGSSLPHVFVYGHEPAFETNHKDNLSFFPKERDIFWDSIGRAGARIYFCGHDHFYNRAVIQDSIGNPIRQIIGGTGGGSLKRWSGTYKDDKRVQGEYHNGDHHGYILVMVTGNNVKILWKALVKEEMTSDWHVFDAFAYSISAQ